MAIVVPDPATNEWVPLYSVQTASGLASLPPHHATHEPGGSDPIAAIATLPHHASHEPGGADQIVALSGAVITSGTVADARLSANVALRNAVNQFTLRQRISNAGGDYPRLTFTSIIEALNQKTWEIHVGTSGVLNILSLTDDETLLQGLVQIARDGVLYAQSGLGATPLNANQLTSGTVADARLSANVVLKPIARADLPAGVAFRDVNNNFVAQTLAAGCIISGANSLFYWTGTENPVDQRNWRVVTYGDGMWRLEALNDAQSVIQASFNFQRNGTLNVSALQAASMGISGNLTVQGGITAQYLTAFPTLGATGRAAPVAGEIQANLVTSFGNVVANGIVSAAGGLGSTPLNASQLTNGTVPLGRLGTNAPSGSTYLRGDNTWQTLASPESFPSGLIVLSTSPCPAGWTRITSLDGRFLRVGNAGATGGADTHSHGVGSLSVAAHSHGGQTGTVSVSVSGSTSDAGNHSHSTSASGSGTTAVTSSASVASPAGSTYMSGPHAHDFSVNTTGSTNSTGNHSHSFSGSGSGTGSIASEGPGVSGTTAAASNVPAYYEIYLCQKN